MKLFRLTPTAKKLIALMAITSVYNSSSGQSSNSSYSVSSVATTTVSFLDTASKVITDLFLSDSNSASSASSDQIAYNRKDWQHWIDADKDCQNTRNEVLILKTIEPSSIVFNEKVRRCTVKKGKWIDPYSSKVITNPAELDIDHIVPLSWAHSHGAASWAKSKKKTFANDYTNLLPVQLSLNRKKGDKGPTDWMPPNNQYRCSYLKDFNAVVIKYHLQYTNTEQRIVKKMQSACTGS